MLAKRSSHAQKSIADGRDPGQKGTMVGDDTDASGGDRNDSDGGRDGSKLCLACGLCCAGALFGHVRLTPSEVPRISALGLSIYSPADYPALRQPCSALEGTTCRIYEERPMRCIAYRCHLLEAFEADEVSFDEAMGVVTLAKELEGVQRSQFVDLHFRGRARRRS